ncbi:MAG: hypothetical protein KGL70_15780 [Betaproteobacteria bacterium]|nr:hypothetical protein [Betaproteobacteria bacterium]MDE2360832.1 hypothetical protein [Betaproteobacteria bacterium]
MSPKDRPEGDCLRARHDGETTGPKGLPEVASRSGTAAWLCAICAALALSACALGPPMRSAPAQQPTAPPLPRNAEPPAPAINLSGFPLSYRQGYADGCASSGGVVHKDASRFAADPNYRTGWQDGVALCRRK